MACKRILEISDDDDEGPIAKRTRLQTSLAQTTSSNDGPIAVLQTSSDDILKTKRETSSIDILFTRKPKLEASSNNIPISVLELSSEDVLIGLKSKLDTSSDNSDNSVIVRSKSSSADESSTLTLPSSECAVTASEIMHQDLIIHDSVHTAKVQPKLVNHLLEHQLLPTKDELQHSPKSLKKNTIKGLFQNVSEYLHIFSSLLKEDFIYPLRQELNELSKANIYEVVSLSCCVPLRSGSESVLCRLKFKSRRKRTNWESSTCFTYGNLLCLSWDNFNTLFFATIFERNIDDLRDQILTVNFIGETAAQNARLISQKLVNVQMFESPSYYEAYAPIMKRLESMKHEVALFPSVFEKYFIEAHTSINKPLYLRNQYNCRTLNLHNVICTCGLEDCSHSAIETTEIEQIKLQDARGLDQSQVEALCTALTRELVLIQGPPGTGKTYIGLKIVQALLINKALWVDSSQKTSKTPIMVVCYTNHALDQFLEGVIKIKQQTLPSLEIRRLGGQSRNKALEPYNIKQYFHKACHELHICLYSHKKLFMIQKQLDALQNLLNGKFDPTRSNLELYSFILSPNILHELFQMCWISTTLPNLSKWGLIFTKESNPNHNELETDRQVSFGEDEILSQKKGI